MKSNQYVAVVRDVPGNRHVKDSSGGPAKEIRQMLEDMHTRLFERYMYTYRNRHIHVRVHVRVRVCI